MESYSIQLAVSGNVALESYRTIQLAALGTILPSIPSGAGGIITQQFGNVSPRGYEEIQMFIRQPYGYIEVQGAAIGWCGRRDLIGVVQFGAYGAIHGATYTQEVLTQMEVTGATHYPPIFPKITTTTSGNLYQDFIRWDDRYDSVVSGYKVISRDFSPVATGFDSITAPTNVFVDPRTNSTENTYALTLPATPTTAYSYQAGDIISVQLPICPFTAGAVSINISGFHFSGIYPPYDSAWTSVAATDPVSLFFDATKDIYFNESQVGKPYVLNMQMSAIQSGTAITYEINGPSGYLGIGNPIIYAGSGTVSITTPSTLTETVISDDSQYTKRIIVPDRGDDNIFYTLSTTSGYLTFPHQIIDGLTEFTVDAWWKPGTTNNQVLWGGAYNSGNIIGTIDGKPGFSYVENLIINSDFESGELTPWEVTQAGPGSGEVVVYAGSGYLGTSGCVVTLSGANPPYATVLSGNIFNVSPEDIIDIDLIYKGNYPSVAVEDSGPQGVTHYREVDLGDGFYRRYYTRKITHTGDHWLVLTRVGSTTVQRQMTLDNINVKIRPLCIGTTAPETNFSGHWIHQTAIWKSGEYAKTQIYYNGTLHTMSQTFTGNITFPDTSYIAGASGLSDSPVEIGSFRVWNRVLSEDELSQIRFSPFMYDNSTLVCYRFNSADGQTVYDLTDNNNDAYLGSGVDSDIWDPIYTGPYIFFTPAGPQ